MCKIASLTIFNFSYLSVDSEKKNGKSDNSKTVDDEDIMILEEDSKIVKPSNKNQNFGTANPKKETLIEVTTSTKTNLQCRTCNVSFAKNIQLLNHIGKMHGNEPKNPAKKRKVESEPSEKFGGEVLSDLKKTEKRLNDGHVWVKDFVTNTWQLVKPPPSTTPKTGIS